ncbi:MAG: type IV toxin-antitoxin system AbiEi family antitoxin domain-containing protein [Candidatus Micrarchaeota archaeon]
MKYAKELREEFSKKPVFSLRDIRTRFAAKKISSAYANVLLNHLLKRNEMHRIARGFYSFHNDPNVIAFAIQPSYFGLQDALSFHGLWQQQTIPILITPRKIRSSFRLVLGSKVLVKRTQRTMFFGIEMKKYLDFWVPVSDPEKTLIDFFYFSQPLEKTVLKKLLKKTNPKKLREYLKQVPKKTRKKIEKALKLRHRFNELWKKAKKPKNGRN